MAYPSVIYAPETSGEHLRTYSTKRWPYGTKLILQDGREFRFAEVGAVALTVGVLVQSEVPGANFDALALPAAVSANAKSFDITNGATTIAAGDFDEGFINVEDDAGEGHLYKIVDHDAEAAGSAAFTVFLASGVIVAMTTATTVGIVKHPTKDVIIHPSPQTAAIVGAVTRAQSANQFGWLQVKGPASVQVQGTHVIGDLVVPSATTDGACMPSAAIETDGPPVGVCMEVAATTEHGLVALDILGFS